MVRLQKNYGTSLRRKRKHREPAQVLGNIVVYGFLIFFIHRNVFPFLAYFDALAE